MTRLGSARSGRRCPPELELTLAISNGVSPALSAHLDGCARCTTSWHQLSQPRELARHLPSPSPSGPELEQIRTRLLIALAEARPSRVSGPTKRRAWRRTAVFAASAALAAVAIAAWRIPRASRGGPSAAATESHAYHGTVHPRPGALFAREGSAWDEIVRLREGVATFDVEPLLRGERFRVITGDGEVEVRGTSFRVEVAGDRLRAVHVERGRVEVRAQGRRAVVLGPGDDWKSARTLAGAVAGSGNAVPSAPSPSEAAFIEAWSAFRSGRLVGAIEAFDDVLRLDPTGPLTEDARYWKAVARARTGSRSAIDDLGSFLSDYPRSPHADEAAVLLGWKLLETGRRDEAARAFRAASAARDQEVRKSARAGMHELQELHRPSAAPTPAD